MAWVKIDDRFDEHPKWDNAPGDSIALWVAAMAWCNRNDSHTGYIPHTKTLGLVNVRSHKATITDLMTRGVIHAHEGGYLIHDYEEYQQNEKVKALRAKRAAAGKLGARARWGNSNGMANAIDLPADSVANGSQTDGNEDAPRPDYPDTSSSTDDDRPTDWGEVSVVVIDRIALAMAQRLWLRATHVDQSKQGGWIATTRRNIAAERVLEISDAYRSTPEASSDAIAERLIDGRPALRLVANAEPCTVCEGRHLIETPSGWHQCECVTGRPARALGGSR